MGCSATRIQPALRNGPSGSRGLIVNVTFRHHQHNYLAYPRYTGGVVHSVATLQESYQAAADELVIFIDEAGDARLNDPHNRLFVLAGCIALGGSMDAVAEDWKDISKSVLGNSESPLHFTQHQRQIRRGSRESHLDAFFNRADIGRVGVAISESSGIKLSSTAGSLVIRAAFDELLFQQAQIIKVRSSKVSVIFEDSVIMRRVYELCRSLVLVRDGNHDIPLQFISVTKANNLTWLEMADAMAHTLAGSVRTLGSNERFERRRQAIFMPNGGAPAVARDLVATFVSPNDVTRMSMTVAVRASN
jgi:hypothetical protein